MKQILNKPEEKRTDEIQSASSPLKENHPMPAQRYQRGSLSLQKRKSKPSVWVFRYYAEENGRRVYKKQTIGSVVELPKRKDAEKAVLQLRIDINEGAAFAPMNIEQLVAHYKNNELPSKAYSTAENYKVFLNTYVVPKWGKQTLSAIKGTTVENWLKKLKRVDGEPASPATKAKIRNVMSALYAHAIRNAWAASNPISTVRTSSQRLKDPEILTPEEVRMLLGELEPRERMMVLLIASTGLRRGELIALRWQDIDFETCTAFITHSVWHNVEGKTKTRASRKPVPVPLVVINELKAWRQASLYKADDDFIFPSTIKNGKKPISPDMILKRHIRPALKHLKIEKRIGWHSFRHGFSNLLRQNGVEIKTIQELLRHANSRITLGYLPAECDRRTEGSAGTGLQESYGRRGYQHPSAPGIGGERRGHDRMCLI
jgi:integrase